MGAPDLGDDPECAAVFGTFVALCRDELAAIGLLAEYDAFDGRCRKAFNLYGQGDAVAVLAASGDPQLCFAAVCRALEVDHGAGVVVEQGCEADGVPDAVCRLGCSEGYEASASSDGHCVARIDSTGTVTTDYEGQAVSCRPEQNPDGSMAESYCRLEEQQAILNCCELQAKDNPGQPCATAQPPADCSVGCAELWLPIVEDCGQYMADRQVMGSDMS